MGKMARIGTGVLLLMILCSAPTGFAQPPVTLDSAQIELWPEYDRPEMLVIVTGNLPGETPLPTTLSLTLPPAGTLFAAAVRDEQGELVNATYATGIVDGSTVVTMTLTQPNFHIEYYDGALVTDGNQRRFTFTWPAGLSAAAAQVRVQEPAGASNLIVTPPLSPAGTGEFGLNYLAGNLGPISAGQTPQVAVTYDKTSTGLSADTGAATAAPAPAVAGSSLLPAPVVIGLAVLVGAMVVGLWLWNRRRTPAPSPARRNHTGPKNAAAARRPGGAGPASAATPPATAAPVERPAAGGVARFCTGCGQPLQAGDRFCRACGTAVQST